MSLSSPPLSVFSPTDDDCSYKNNNQYCYCAADHSTNNGNQYVWRRFVRWQRLT